MTKLTPGITFKKDPIKIKWLQTFKKNTFVYASIYDDLCAETKTMTNNVRFGGTLVISVSAGRRILARVF